MTILDAINQSNRTVAQHWPNIANHPDICRELGHRPMHPIETSTHPVLRALDARHGVDAWLAGDDTTFVGTRAQPPESEYHKTMTFRWVTDMGETESEAQKMMNKDDISVWKIHIYADETRWSRAIGAQTRELCEMLKHLSQQNPLLGTTSKGSPSGLTPYMTRNYGNGRFVFLPFELIKKHCSSAWMVTP